MIVGGGNPSYHINIRQYDMFGHYTKYKYAGG